MKSLSTLFARQHISRATLVKSLNLLVIVMVAVSFAVPAFAQEAVTLDLDVQPVFDSINTYLPVFLPIIAIGGGIAIALVLGRFIVNAIIDAFKGNKV